MIVIARYPVIAGGLEEGIRKYESTFAKASADKLGIMIFDKRSNAW